MKPPLVPIVRAADGRGEDLLLRLSSRGSLDTGRAERPVRKIVTDVRREGDRALRRYAVRLDRLGKNQSFRVSADELEEAWEATHPQIRSALQSASRTLRRFAEWQKPAEWTRSIVPGVRVGQVLRPVRAVGCYVPGGRYPLPSTLLMTVIPAQVAGVERIVVVSPNPARETLAAASLLGISEFHRVGGAQAVAALAYGTESVPRVDKIVGPGNIYVTTAKKLVAFDCGIDMLAGPTEAIVVAHAGKASLIAADLVAQAEHDPDALAIFVTANERLAREVQTELSRQAEDNPIARQSLATNGVIFQTDTRRQAVEIANRLAPEHITIEAPDLDSITDAGSVFVGEYSPQTMGDYISGPNHVLPTGGVAHYRGGLSVLDFLKIITVQQLTKEGLARLGPAAIQMAEAEGLAAHANSVRIRGAHA